MDSKSNFGLTIDLPTLQHIIFSTKHSGNAGVASLNSQFSCAHLQVCPEDNGLFHGISYFGSTLALRTKNESSGSGSGTAIAPERICGFGFSGALTGTSGPPRVGGSLPAAACA